MRAVGTLAIPFPNAAVWRLNHETNAVNFSPNLHKLLGRSKDWRPREVCDLVQGALTGRHGDKSVERFLENPYYEIQENGEITLTYLLQRDDGKQWFHLRAMVTESRKNRDLKETQAIIFATAAPDRPDTDDLTGLLHRGIFLRKVKDALQSASSRYRVAIFRLDMDYLRVINMFGHHAGDLALVRSAQTIHDIAERWGQSVFACRIGGDELALAAVGLTRKQITALADELILNTDFKINVGDEDEPVELPISLSIGLADSDGSIDDVVELDWQADAAQAWAKQHKAADGSSRFQRFTPEMADFMRREYLYMMEIRDALLKRNIKPHYEPLVDTDLQIVGVEALTRWHRQNGSIVLPEGFLNYLSSYIVDHDLQIIMQGAEDVMRLKAETGRQLKLHANILPAALCRSDFLMMVQHILAATKLPAECLVLEVVEYGPLPSLDIARKTARGLQSIGIRLAMDDYPEGNSTILRLMQLPYFSIVKFAGSMVDSLGLDETDEPSCTALRLFANEVQHMKKMGLTVLVEHVDSRAVFDFLCTVDADEMQGYLFGGRPDNLEIKHAMDIEGIKAYVLGEDDDEDGWRSIFADLAASG